MKKDDLTKELEKYNNYKEDSVTISERELNEADNTKSKNKLYTMY